MRIRMEVRSGSGILEDIRETPDISEIKLEKLIGSLKKDIVRYIIIV